MTLDREADMRTAYAQFEQVLTAERPWVSCCRHWRRGASVRACWSTWRRRSRSRTTRRKLALAEFLEHPTEGIFRGPYLRCGLPFRPAATGWRQALDWHPLDDGKGFRRTGIRRRRLRG